MGWDTRSLTVNARVSSHNSDRDVADNADWEEFVSRVKAIAKEHRYDGIQLDVMGG